MIKKVAYTLLYLFSLAGIIFLVGFAADRSRNIPCSGPFVSIESRSGNYFINAETVHSIITERFDTLEGRTVSREKLQSMHSVINDIACVETANVFRAGTGKLGIEITLRDPVIRVINRSNESYYIDRNGYLFPLSDAHTARVMVATGSISTGYAPGRNVNCAGEDEVEDEVDMRDLNNLFKLASFIHNDPFWKAFIDHIYLLPNGKFELMPKNGAHTIEFGKAQQLEEKFGKLRLFYMNSLPQAGWHYYSRINLEYRNQVICSR